MPPPPLPVLIVDDDPTAGAVLRGLLRNAEGGLTCAPKWVASGTAAMAEIRRTRYELVLLDYQMPDTDGLTILSQINELPETERPVVIMLTGSGNEQVAVEAMKRGAKDYLIKSGVKLPALRRAILGALDRHRLEDQLAHSTDEIRLKNAQIETDLAMAREVQQALLPSQYPVFPPNVAAAESALRFAQRWIPSQAVAGDFFAIFPVSESTAGLLLCDVMGHGVRAALVAALLHGLVRELRNNAAAPAAFLGELNRQLQALLARINNLIFVTAVYVVIDSARGEVRFANAGHPHPLLLRRDLGRVEELIAPGGPGAALGMIPDETYATGTVALETDDSLVLFTDGVVEAEDPRGEQFGTGRFRAVVTSRLQQPSAEILDMLLAELHRFRGGTAAAPFADDVCLVAADFVRHLP